MPYILTLKTPIVTYYGENFKTEQLVRADKIIADGLGPVGLLEYVYNKKINYVAIDNLLGVSYFEETPKT